MSWAAHNPERWTEILNKGIAKKLIDKRWNKPSEEDILIFLDDLEHNGEVGRRVHEVLVDWAQDEINDVHANYVGGLIDAAKERFDDRSFGS